MPGYISTYTFQPAASHAPQFAPRDYKHFAVEPVTGAMGAVVTGIDLRTADDEAIAELDQALVDHLALMIRDQDLTPEQQIVFARRLGTPVPWPHAKPMEGYPEITELIQEPDDKYAFGGGWHSDSCSFERPPKNTMLYCVESPPVGGDTAFSNQYLAWETLDPALRDELEHVKCLHSDEIAYATVATSDEVVANTATPITFDRGTISEALHPVARTHPVTGRKALYTNSGFTAGFGGKSQEESLPLLEKLWEHSTTQEFTCRLRWKKGSLAIWDNRCCMHYATSDYPGHRRHMRRMVLAGERPV